MQKFFVIILFIGACVGTEVPKNYYIANEYNDNEEKHIIRPCRNLDCIRHYFERNAHCTPVRGVVPDPLNMPEIVLPIPNANLTCILTKVQINGLNGKVVEFYVNKRTERAVLAVELRDLTLSSPAAYLLFHRKAMEPLVTSDYAYVTYKSITLTAVFPVSHNLQLSQAMFTAYIDDPNPRYSMGPNINKSEDPVVVSSFAALISAVNDSV